MVQMVKNIVSDFSRLAKLPNLENTCSTVSLVKSFPTMHKIIPSYCRVQKSMLLSLSVNKLMVTPG